MAFVFIVASCSGNHEEPTVEPTPVTSSETEQKPKAVTNEATPTPAAMQNTTPATPKPAEEMNSASGSVEVQPATP